VLDVLDGFNATIMAYGQTGTGKTFTVFGPEGMLDPASQAMSPTASREGDRERERESGIRGKYAGIIPRAVLDIFGHIARHRDREEYQ
ncbi:kinesin-like protein, partial [Kipferlia bialata]